MFLMVRLVALTWRIGELARETGLTIRTLHHYDAIGFGHVVLCAPAADIVSTLEPDVERLYAVVVLRRIGLSTAVNQRAARGTCPGRFDQSCGFSVPNSMRSLPGSAPLRHRLDAMLLLAVEEPAGLIRAMQQLPSTPFAVRRAFALLQYDDVEDAQRPARRHVRLPRAGSRSSATRMAQSHTRSCSRAPASSIFIRRMHGVVMPGPDGRASAIIVAAVADVDVHCAHATGARRAYHLWASRDELRRA